MPDKITPESAAMTVLEGLYFALPDVLPAWALERFQRTGKWLGPSAWALRGFTATVTYRSDDMACVYAAMDEAAAILKHTNKQP